MGALNQCMKKPELMLELLTMISSCTVLKPGWRPSHHFGQVPSPGQWKLSCSSRDPDVENSAAGLVDADMTTVVATDYDGSRSREHFIQASFDRPVLIVAVHLGIGDLHGQGWSQEYLDSASIEYSNDEQSWVQVATARIPTMDVIHKHQLSEPIAARYWRLMKNSNNDSLGRLAISCLQF